MYIRNHAMITITREEDEEYLSMHIALGQDGVMYVMRRLDGLHAHKCMSVSSCLRGRVQVNTNTLDTDKQLFLEQFILENLGLVSKSMSTRKSRGSDVFRFGVYRLELEYVNSERFDEESRFGVYREQYILPRGVQ